MRTRIVVAGILALSVSVGVASHRAASQDALGQPEGSGLVVVEVGFERSKAFKLFGGGGQNVRAYLLWLGDMPRVVEAVESKDLIVFSGLRPGPYRLDAITATMKSGNLSTPLEARMPGDDARFSVDVKPGVPIYLGKVTIVDQQRMFPVSRSRPGRTSPRRTKASPRSPRRPIGSSRSSPRTLPRTSGRRGLRRWSCRRSGTEC